jgi:hypothetical protein
MLLQVLEQTKEIQGNTQAALVDQREQMYRIEEGLDKVCTRLRVLAADNQLGALGWHDMWMEQGEAVGVWGSVSEQVELQQRFFAGLNKGLACAHVHCWAWVPRVQLSLPSLTPLHVVVCVPADWSRPHIL